MKKSLISDASGIESIPAHLTALKRINVDIKHGKLTVVLGDIGSGKSSLLYCMLA
jgi:ABC-type lipoprotein export system ATPase subunit